VLLPDTLIALGRQASCTLEAEPLMKRALEGKEATLDALHPETMPSVAHMVELLRGKAS